MAFKIYYNLFPLPDNTSSSIPIDMLIARKKLRQASKESVRLEAEKAAADQKQAEQEAEWAEQAEKEAEQLARTFSLSSPSLQRSSADP